MTREELRLNLYALVRDQKKVDQIFALFGKLSPEPKSKPQVPKYDLQLVVRAGEKFKFTEEDRKIVQELMRGFNLEA